MFVSPHALTSRAVWHITEKGWSSDFPPLPSAFSGKYPMAFMLRSHNGVHCCGTVGDSHSSSQLSTAKCTFTGGLFPESRYKGKIIFWKHISFSDLFLILGAKNKELSIIRNFTPRASSNLHSLNRSLPGFLPTREELVHQSMEAGIMARFQQMAQLMNHHMLDTPFRQQQQIGREADGLVPDVADTPS